MQTIIHTFYEAFKNADSEAMNACYHDDIEFCDPAFGVLKGDRAKAMWTMLCQNGKDVKVEYSNIKADENKGSAHWEARYTFSQTGRKVHNVLEAKFEFKDGKIIKHSDDFHLRTWAKQALGFKGFLLGGTSFFQKKLNEQTSNMLTKFQESKA